MKTAIVAGSILAFALVGEVSGIDAYLKPPYPQCVEREAANCDDGKCWCYCATDEGPANNRPWCYTAAQAPNGVGDFRKCKKDDECGTANYNACAGPCHRQ
jgi:hypothetical protein